MNFFRSAALAALILLTSCSSEPPENWGVQVDGGWIPVIDLHTHTGEWAQMPPGFHERMTERVPSGFKWTMGPVTDWILESDNILGQMNSAGIYGAGVFALYSPNTTGNAPNEFVAERIAAAPERLYGFASIRVDNWNNDAAEQLAQFEQALQFPGMVGVKLAHGHQQFRFDDERFYPIYEIAGRLGKPMYLHTGTSPNPGTRFEPEYADPMYLEEAIRRYPDAVFILGHSGYDSKEKALTYTDSAIYLARIYDNVYMEPGALGAERAAELIDDFVTRVKDGGVLDKVIYGSDGVQFPGYLKSHLENYVAAMKRNDYTADEMSMVLSGNFARVFGIDVPGVPATTALNTVVEK
jgi:predicted TIM-barrel fold metal-dependent hydrolase